MSQLVKINDHDLQIKVFNNQRVVTFKDIDKVHERSEGTAGRNFRENKEHFIEGTDYFFVKPADIQTDEIRRSEINNSGTYLITESGYLMLVKSFTDDLAWKVQRQLVNTYFRAKDLNPYKGLSKELQAIFLIDKKTQEIEERVDKLENKMTIDYSQQEEIRTKATQRVIQVLGGKDVPAYKELNKKAFAALWRDYKRALDVNSYRNTAVKDFDKALNYVATWKPARELELMIKGANSQMRI
ncbi:ORF6C domain-containing protein [Clostridium thermopalmarium]|uniref:ORF6C domain protein n=1 Tax=Clostridium thermopalmarium DSM 5974 TaxID=1121340 RepID=A0A2T0APD8_9CLOT|nr:ORF6C domain-containing protein [Clostridium thermopalmarium]PRR70879.1 ORF6C domain protein [Clostridium thermopalmarium DSM 5974]PVZ28803.1 ORF6N domain-containing protein [Clostridium thermopalmarium DSM 5974]